MRNKDKRDISGCARLRAWRLRRAYDNVDDDTYVEVTNMEGNRFTRPAITYSARNS